MNDPVTGQEPYPYLTRVHHRGAEHSFSDSDKDGGWGTVISAYPCLGGYEYEVEVTHGIAGERLEGAPRRVNWGSHHINRAVTPEGDVARRRWEASRGKITGDQGDSDEPKQFFLVDADGVTEMPEGAFEAAMEERRNEAAEMGIDFPWDDRKHCPLGTEQG